MDFRSGVYPSGLDFVLQPDEIKSGSYQIDYFVTIGNRRVSFNTTAKYKRVTDHGKSRDLIVVQFTGFFKPVPSRKVAWMARVTQEGFNFDFQPRDTVAIDYGSSIIVDDSYKLTEEKIPAEVVNNQTSKLTHLTSGLLPSTVFHIELTFPSRSFQAPYRLRGEFKFVSAVKLNI